MNLEAIPTGPYEEICYLAWGHAKETLVFDPGDDAHIICDVLDREGLKVAAYICTHGHADHLNALAELHSARPAPVAIHSDDLEWAFTEANQIQPYYATPQRPNAEKFLALESSKDWFFADLHFQCIETPGHSPGSCCLLFPETAMLIAGDTLFKGSCGRTDLPGGNPRQLKESLNKLKLLPDEVRVFPGHGPDTTIGIERLTNFFMQ
jgi:glyoxylase-like metal-dependent hydrolase (beta-lactamase superfamily II)